MRSNWSDEKEKKYQERCAVVDQVQKKLDDKISSWLKCYPNSDSVDGVHFYGELSVYEIRTLLELIEESEALTP